MTASTLTIRLPAEVKAEMAAHGERNWSAFLRDSLDAELARIKREAAARRIAAVRAAMPAGGPGAVELVRAMRDGRYGERT